MTTLRSLISGCILFAALASGQDKAIVAVDTINGTLPATINQKLASEGHVIRFTKSPITPDQLEGVSALLVCAPFTGNGSAPPKGVKYHSIYRNEEIKTIVEFVRNGGLFVGAGQVWSWQSYGDKPAKDHPLNQIGSGLGFDISGSVLPFRFLESTITSKPETLKLDASAVYSVVNVGRSFREKIITTNEKEICAAGARRANGFVYIFGHELAIMENPEILLEIINTKTNPAKNDSDMRQKNELKTAITAPEGMLSTKGQDPLNVLSVNSPNIISWLSSPLDTLIPKEISVSISILREDIMDAGSSDTKNIEVYKSAAILCDGMIKAIGYREKKQAEAKLEVAKAKSDAPLSNQALNARRNYQMSWPQYEREIQQRNALEKKRSAAEELEYKSHEAKWAEKAINIRQKLNQLFQNYRAQKREAKK